MGFPKWLKPVGKVGLEIGKAAGQAALQTAQVNPVIGVAWQIAQASLSHGQVSTTELVKTLNVLLVPQGYIVIPVPKETAQP